MKTTTKNNDRVHDHVASYESMAERGAQAHQFEQLFHTAFSMATDAMLILNADNLLILDANEAAVRLYGYTREEFIGLLYTQLSADPTKTEKILKSGYNYYSCKKHIKKNRQQFNADVGYGHFSVGRQNIAVVSVRKHPEVSDCLENMQIKEKLILEDKLLKRSGQEEAFILGEESERLRISRELHDHIGQLVVGAKFSLEKGMAQSDEEKRTEHLKATLDLLIETIDEIHNVSHHVVSGCVKSGSINESINCLVIQFSKSHNIAVEYDNGGLPENLKAFAQVNIFRIVEELLSNVRKHAGATRLWISLGCDDNKLLIEFRDNGNGLSFHPPKSSLGLMVMKHRVGLLGGEISFSSTRGKFFRTTVSVPLGRWQACHEGNIAEN